MTWNECFVQLWWKAHSFPVLRTILGQFDDFKNFDARKCDLAKTCCAWHKTSVLYNFHGKCTVFPFWREFQARVTILRTLTLKNAIWPKRAAHDLKRTFGRIFRKSALFSRFEENLRAVWRFWQLWRSQMRFGKNVLCMTWKEGFTNFHEKRTVLPFWKEFQASVTILRTLTLKNAIWPKGAAHDLKRTFGRILMNSELFSRLKENLGQV